MLKLIKVVVYSNYRYIFVLRKEAIKRPIKKPYKDEKFKTRTFVCCCCSCCCNNSHFNPNTLQIMKNYLSKQKPQILTAQIIAAYFLINLIFR